MLVQAATTRYANVTPGQISQHQQDIGDLVLRLTQRIFRYGSSTEYAMQIVATFCALASGVGMALVNLVFGKFINIINDYVAGKSTPSEFRSDAARLSYAVPTFLMTLHWSRDTNSFLAYTSSSSVWGDLSSVISTAHYTHLPHIGSPATSAACI